MVDTARILIVDDEPDIRESLSDHLSRLGFEPATAASAKEARDHLAQSEADLVVLDIMMPGEDGLSLCRSLRATSNIPVILLTALADETDRIVGLEIGADDYLTKPFSPRELVARIKAVLRRALTDTADAGQDMVLHFGKWTLDPDQAELHRKDGVIVPLSTGELSILKVFLSNPGATLSRDDIMEQSRGRETLPFERTIDNMISRLRRKVEDDPKNPRLIKTVRGGGYRLVTDH